MYTDIYGLSCVENHILAIMNEQKQNIALTYFDCALPFEELFFHISTKHITQAYFNFLPRIQDILKNNCIISLERYESDTTDMLIHDIESCDCSEAILMKVTPEYTKTTLHARGLRPDHYVYINNTLDLFTIFNDIPATIHRVEPKELHRIWGGDWLKLKINRALDISDAISFWNQRKYKPENHTNNTSSEPNITNVHDFSQNLQNTVGIYKILRKRLVRYYGMYVNCDSIKEMIPDIDKQYALIEYHMRKQKDDISKFLSIYHNLCHTENDIMSTLGESIRRSYCV